MLVPTTLLVRQHLETFQERFAGFPVHLRAAQPVPDRRRSRRRRSTGLADGTVDMVIGTHRLLSEQHRLQGPRPRRSSTRSSASASSTRTQLKKLKTNVDILAMSATPIPRTLEMAVTGIREMSTLATPPEDRHPILTFVGPLLRQAGRRRDPPRAAARGPGLLRAQPGLVDQPGRRRSSPSSCRRRASRVAHGQLGEHQLEQVIVDFWERKFDVLVSTTIIETGLDIAEREHADHRPRRQVRALAAAPAARPRRPRPRARLRLLPLRRDKPLSETAARPARDHRRQQRARLAACRSR